MRRPAEDDGGERETSESADGAKLKQG